LLGSIKGSTSLKFGIYERRIADKKPKNYVNDDKYSWMKRYGNNRFEAYNNIKNEVLEIIKHAETGNFKDIDNLLLPDLFKWKVAFLYSNERLIPIFQTDALYTIAQNFGMKTDRHTRISDIQQLMMSQKPPNVDVHSYMWYLFEKFGRKRGEKKAEEIRSGDKLEATVEKARMRKAVEIKNTNSQVRTVARSYIVTQRHNKLQEALKNKLVGKYGKEAVRMEENYVDIKVLLPDSIDFYDVKSSPYASDCTREALGQILSYSFTDKDPRRKKIVVVGQYLPNNQEIEFIHWLKSNLNIEFEYENIDIA
jgi:hypothetical protein